MIQNITANNYFDFYALKNELTNQYDQSKKENAQNLLKIFFEHCFNQFSTIEIIKWKQSFHEVSSNSEGEEDVNFYFDFLILVSGQEKFLTIRECGFDYKLESALTSFEMKSNVGENSLCQMFFEAFEENDWLTANYYCINRQLEFSKCE